MDLISVRTFDSMLNRDTVISAVTKAESEANAKRVHTVIGANFGELWAGVQKEISLMSPADAADAKKKIRDTYRPESEFDLSATTTDQSLNAAHRKANGQSQLDHDGPSRGEAWTPAMIQQKNDAFWHGQK